MDILEQYEKQYSSTPQEKQEEHLDIPKNATITKWLIDHSDGYITNERQANHVMTGFAVLIVLASLFLVLNGSKFSLTPEEARLFIGKTASEKLLVPQNRDKSLFNK